MNVSLQPLWSNDDGSVEVKSSPLTIGRADGSDLQLHSGMVSRHHAELILDHDSVLIRDLESSNGTYVNGEPVEHARTLQDGDVVTFAVVPFEVHIGHGVTNRIRRFFRDDAQKEPSWH